MNNNYPDKWVVVEISTESKIFRKILTSWYGGYVGSDSWQLSSMIVDCADKESRYEFITDTGSKYFCNKNSYGMNSLASTTFKELEEKAIANNILIKIVDKHDSCRSA